MIIKWLVKIIKNRINAQEKKMSPAFTIMCKPCKITTHFYYPQMFVSGTPSVFFADVLVDILGFRFRLIFSMHLVFNNFYERKATFQFKIILVAAM